MAGHAGSLSGGGLLRCLAYANPVRDADAHVIGAVNMVADLTPLETLNIDRAAAATVATRLKADTLAIIEIALAVLTGLRWPASAFARPCHAMVRGSACTRR